MPDQRSVLKEYRALEQKRLAQGLTPAEDRRHAELRALVGSDPSAAGPARGGFDVNAAAARLRDSLLPAGLRNRPPPAPELVTPEQLAPPEPDPIPEPAPLEAAYDTQPFPPVDAASTDVFFDPASLGDAAPAVEQAAWDAGAAYDPNAPQGEWDPNAPQVAWDPNAPQAAWDPNAPQAAWDPNAPQAAWDPNANATQAAWDPNAPQAAWDPNAPQAAWDPNAPQAEYDPNAPQAGWDPNAPQAAWDPSAQPYDPAQPWDPNAAAYEPGSQPHDPDAPVDPGAAQPAWDAGTDAAAWAEPAGGFDPASLGAEAAADGGPAPLEAPEPAAGFAPAAEPEAGGLPGDWAAFDAPPAEPAGELAEDPYALVPATDLDVLDTEPAPPPPAGSSEQLPAAWEAAPPAEAPPALEVGEYDAAGPAAFPPLEELEGALPFDAAAASAIPAGELPEGFEPVPGEYDDGAGFGVAGHEAPLAPQLGGAAAPPEAPPWQPEHALDQGFQLASGGSFDAAADAASPAWAGAAPEPAAPWEQHGELTEPEPEPDLGPPPELDRSGGHLTSDDPADDFFAISAPPLALGGPGAMAPPASPPASTAAPPAVLTPPAPEPLPSIDEIPELEPEEILEAEEAGISEVTEVAEEIVHPPEAAAEAPPDLDFPTTIAEPFPPSPSPADFAAAAAAAAAEPPPPEVPAEAASPEPQPAPGPAEAPPLPAEDVSFEEEAPAEASSPIVAGAHRVVVHTLEGLVRRGVLQDADLAAPVLGLAPSPGAEPEVLGADKVKAIFFMLAPGEPAPAPEGKRVRVTFRDGRQVAGFSPDYREDGFGFFMIPADARTNTGRIWIYRAAVKQVLVS